MTEAAATRLGEIFVNFLKKRMREKIYPYGNPDVKGVGNKVASGDLYKSIQFKVVQIGDDSYSIEFNSLDYFEYVNRGRRPGAKRVPLDELLKWISIRKIKPQGYKGRGRYPIKNKLSLGFAIQQNIFKYGIRPSRLIDKTYDSLEAFFQNPPPNLQQELGEVFNMIEQDINVLIENIINNPQPK